MRDYGAAVTDVIGVEPIWDDKPEWTGRYLVDRARGWGWHPKVSWDEALAELADGLR